MIDLVTDVAALELFRSGAPCSVQPGPDPSSRLVVVTGQNATGKSLFRRLLSAALKHEKVEPIPVSMELRSEGGMMRAFVFGSESYQATGEITAHSILGGIKTSRSRAERHSIIWDEPDIGLSDDYAAGAGLEIKEFLSPAPEKLFGVVVMTHRRCLIQQLLDLAPHHVRFGDDLTLDQVMKARITPRRLKQLDDASLALFRKLTKEFPGLRG